MRSHVKETFEVARETCVCPRAKLVFVRARNVCLSARSDHCHVVNVDVSTPSPFCRLEESKYQGIVFLLNVIFSRTDQFDRTSSK